MSSEKKRMIVDSPEKGKYRYDVIKRAIGRYKEAFDSGYYLEAITLAESLIADRLESRALFLGNTGSDFSTLGQLCKTLSGDSVLSSVIPKINSWRSNRNTSLHELAKIEDGDDISFETKYLQTKQIAEEGLGIFRELDAVLKKSRR